MSISNHSIGRRFVAAVGSLAVTFGAMLGMSPAANAAPEFGNINEDASGNILIHKHENQVDTEIVGDPDQATVIPSAPVADVSFTAYDIVDAAGEKIDLTVPSNWDYLKDLTVSADGSTLTGGPGAPEGPWTIGDSVGSATTGQDGKATISVDEIGAYVVVETFSPEHVVQEALPFIVTIPFPYEDGWIYDVNVYPKNGVVTVGKTIVEQPDDQVGLGSVVQFPVTVRVPGLAPDTSFENYVVQDTLDARLDELDVASVTINGAAVDASYYDVDVTGQTVRVEFTAAGLSWLETQGNEVIEVVFEGKVVELGNGVIENEATLFVNDPDEANGINSNKVHTNWGDLVIEKIDGSDEEATLQGAIFEIYNAEVPYPNEPATCESAVATGDALTVDGDTEFETGSDGKITIPGLFVSDSENDPKDAVARCYVIKEIQAPAGFVTPTGDDAFTGVSVATGATTAVDVTVSNVQQDVPELPLTGAQGRILMIIAGLGVLAIAAGLVLKNRARAKQS